MLAGHTGHQIPRKVWSRTISVCDVLARLLGGTHTLTCAALRRFMPFDEIGRWRLAQGAAPVVNLAAAIVAVSGQLPAQIRSLFHHGRQRGVKLSDPAQGRGGLSFKGGNPIHPATDPEKSTRCHGIETGTKTSRDQRQIGLIPKLTIPPYRGAAWEVLFPYGIFRNSADLPCAHPAIRAGRHPSRGMSAA